VEKLTSHGGIDGKRAGQGVHRSLANGAKEGVDRLKLGSGCEVHGVLGTKKWPRPP